MAETRHCLSCGVEIRPESPTGLCPRCLLEAGLTSEPPHGSGSAATEAAESGGFVPPTVTELQAKFPQFELLELLGKGGMGAVYKARQPGLDRLVAVKILPPEVGRDAAFAERFTREARAMARLSHTNIVGVHDFGQADGLYYFVMEFVDGVNLRQAMLAGSMTPKEALAIVPQICDALQFAHDEGIVHRDIKPENVLIDKRGRIKIADFGLAKLLGREDADRRLTGTHQVMGTLRYMAPEQLEGSHAVDHRADIYSLGVVFYELLTGELPIGRFAPPSKKVQIDVRLDEVVLRALEKEPEQRYQHASELRSGVESLALAPASAVVAADAVSAAVPDKDGLRRMYWLALGVGFVVWWLLPLTWNGGLWGILASCLLIGVIITWLARRAASCFPWTTARWSKFGSAAAGVTLLCGVAFGSLGVYFLTIGLAELWERHRWSAEFNSQQDVVHTYENVEYRLLRELAAYKKDSPRAEIIPNGGSFGGGIPLTFIAPPSLGWFMALTIIGSLLIAWMCISSTFGALLHPDSQFSLRIHWHEATTAIKLAALTVVPLFPYCLALTITSLLAMHGYELRMVSAHSDLQDVVNRIDDWAASHGYVGGDIAGFSINAVPDGHGLARVEARQYWKPLAFDRWQMTTHGIERVSPHLSLLLISDSRAKDTVVRVDTPIRAQGTPENERFTEVINSLSAAIEGGPDTTSKELATKRVPPTKKIDP